MRRSLFFLSLCALLGCPAEGANQIQAGAAKIDITPDGPIWMSGYASRTKPSTGVTRPLYTRALAIDDGGGKARVVFVSTDLIGLPRQVTDLVAARLMSRYKLDRSQIVFNSSHTHTGPAIAGNLGVMGPQDPEQRRLVESYTQRLTAQLEKVVAAALGNLQPAQLGFDYGQASFGVNRRVKTPNGYRIGVNPDGPKDPRVPVLRAMSPAGKLIGTLFGYACHNTTMTGEFYELSGDYAGEAEAGVETAFPGTVALFFELCGGDQNPEPRSTKELAMQHGKALSTEVERVLRSPMQPVSGKLKTAYQTVGLPFAPHTREQYEQEAQSANPYNARRAQQMLKLYDERREPRQLQYPVQAIRFQKGFTMLALGGEVVIDYSNWAFGAFPGERLMVAGYSNDVACYIPSARVLKEGGYEAVDSMVYYGQPGPFTEEVETRIQDTVTQVLRRVM